MDEEELEKRLHAYENDITKNILDLLQSALTKTTEIVESYSKTRIDPVEKQISVIMLMTQDLYARFSALMDVLESELTDEQKKSIEQRYTYWNKEAIAVMRSASEMGENFDPTNRAAHNSQPDIGKDSVQDN